MNLPKEVMTQRNSYGRVFLMIGGVGLAVTLAMNFLALVVVRTTSIEFASPAWWFIWISSYIVWLSFLILGWMGVMVKKAPTQETGIRNDPEPTPLK
jgi:hypothetical protein